jgi:hypothetical protein
VTFRIFIFEKQKDPEYSKDYKASKKQKKLLKAKKLSHLIAFIKKDRGHMLSPRPPVSSFSL